VVAREGFDGVTFRSVAAEAGVTHGLASYHFRTRESMIHEALKWAVEHTLETTHLAASTGRIEDFAADVPRALSESPEDAIFQFELLLRALRSPELREDVRKSYDEYIAAISDSLRAVSVEGDAVARLVFAALDGLALQQLLYEQPRRTEEALSALRALLALFPSRSAVVPRADVAVLDTPAPARRST
jgi:AcrR family transcriptional regulator